MTKGKNYMSLFKFNIFLKTFLFKKNAPQFFFSSNACQRMCSKKECCEQTENEFCRLKFSFTDKTFIFNVCSACICMHTLSYTNIHTHVGFIVQQTPRSSHARYINCKQILYSNARLCECVSMVCMRECIQK